MNIIYVLIHIILLFCLFNKTSFINTGCYLFSSSNIFIMLLL